MTTLTWLKRLPNRRLLSGRSTCADRAEYHGRNLFDKLSPDVQRVFNRIEPPSLRWRILSRCRMQEACLLCAAERSFFKDADGAERIATTRSIVARAAGLLTPYVATLCGEAQCVTPSHLTPCSTARAGGIGYAVREAVVADIASRDRILILNRARVIAGMLGTTKGTAPLISAMVQELEDSGEWLPFAERTAVEDIASIFATIVHMPAPDEDPPSVRRLLGLEVDD